MKSEKMTIANCCDGKFAESFDEAIEQVLIDVERRGMKCLDKRVITLTLEVTPDENGYLSQVCFSGVKLPTRKRTAMAKCETDGIVQLLDDQQQLPLEEKDKKVVPIKAQEGATDGK